MLRRIFVTVQQITQLSKRTISRRYLSLIWSTCSVLNYLNQANWKVKQTKMPSSDSSAFPQRSTCKLTNLWITCHIGRNIRLKTTQSRSSKPRATSRPRNCQTVPKKTQSKRSHRLKKPLPKAVKCSHQRRTFLHHQRLSPKWQALINIVNSL